MQIFNGHFAIYTMHRGAFSRDCLVPYDGTINIGIYKVIREKSRGEGSLIVQDTIENVSEPKFFFNFLRKKNYIF